MTDTQTLLTAPDFICKRELREAIKLLTEVLEDRVDVDIYEGFVIVFDQDSGDVWLEDSWGKTYGKGED